MNYVYYFKDFEDNIIYVGKTGNYKRRMKEHFTKGHLPSECYDEVNKIFVSVVNDSKYDTEICETLLINKYKPKYNVEKKFNENEYKTRYKLLHLDFFEIYYNFETNEVSTKPFEYKCYLASSASEKANEVIKYNISYIEKKRSHIKRYLENFISDDLLEDVLKIYKKVLNNTIPEYSITDKSVTENGDLEDTYASFDINILNDVKISNINLIKIIETGFIFKIKDDIYAVPLLRPLLLIQMNKNYY